MRKFIFFCSVLLTATAMQAQIIHVPGDYPKIQQGIEAANPGDTVLVDDGIYYEQINFLGKKPLMVASNFLLDGDTNHIANTIIDGSQLTAPDSLTVVYFQSGEDTTSILCGFTIQNGKGSFFTIPGLTIRNGGGIFIRLSGAKIIYNHITENHLNDTVPGPAQLVIGAGIGTSGEECDKWVVIDHNVIDHNSCYGSADQISSGGIDIWYNTRITNNTISWNTVTAGGDASAVGGGFCCVADPSWPTVNVIVKNNIITHNIALADNNYANSGGALFQVVSGIFEGNLVEDNEVTSWGSSGGAGGLFIYLPKEGNVVRGNIFKGNTSSLWTGGLHIEAAQGDLNPPMVLVENNYFLDNTAWRGGAFSSLSIPVILQNNVFNGNHATQSGAAMYLWKNTSIDMPHFATLINNSVSGNKSDFYGGGIFAKSASLLIINSVFWNDSSLLLENNEIYQYPYDTAEIANSNISPDKITSHWIDGGGNINEDPLFEDPINLVPYHWSPCVETGVETYTCSHGEQVSAPAFDINNDPRPTGAGYDMGAYDMEGWGIGIKRTTDGKLRITCSPNPFTSSATLTYNLQKQSTVVIRVYDSFGQLVSEPLNTNQSKGDQKVQWNAGNLPAGMYYFRIEADGIVGTGKAIKQ